jgi:hypothetical protein
MLYEHISEDQYNWKRSYPSFTYCGQGSAMLG